MGDFLSESVSIYEQSWSVTGVIGWMWRKLVEYSAGEDDSKVPSGRYVLRKNLEVSILLLYSEAIRVLAMVTIQLLSCNEDIADYRTLRIECLNKRWTIPQDM